MRLQKAFLITDLPIIITFIVLKIWTAGQTKLRQGVCALCKDTPKLSTLDTHGLFQGVLVKTTKFIPASKAVKIVREQQP